VLFHLSYDEGVNASEVDFVLGLGFLLTAHEPAWDPRATIHLRGGLEPILRHGPDHLLWALADDIVDGFFPFADRLGDAIDEVQDDVIRKATPDVLERVFVLKRELIDVRRAISPVREIFNQLTNRDTPIVDRDEIIYFRDIYDHVIRLTDELDNYRELASATLDVYLSTINNNLSTIMKRLTGVTVIIAGVAAIGGIFGMSEAGTALAGQEASGFWIVTGLTLVFAAVASLVLRRIGWI
jgi:magnesium transporter